MELVQARAGIAGSPAAKFSSAKLLELTPKEVAKKLDIAANRKAVSAKQEFSGFQTASEVKFEKAQTLEEKAAGSILVIVVAALIVAAAVAFNYWNHSRMKKQDSKYIQSLREEDAERARKQEKKKPSSSGPAS